MIDIEESEVVLKNLLRANVMMHFFGLQAAYDQVSGGYIDDAT